MKVSYSTKSRVTDPLPLLQVNNRMGNARVHHEIITLLASILSKIVKRINYDHIHTTIPKDPTIPLATLWQGRKKKGDISFIWDNTLVLIEVKTYSLEDAENGKNAP